MSGGSAGLIPPDNGSSVLDSDDPDQHEPITFQLYPQAEDGWVLELPACGAPIDGKPHVIDLREFKGQPEMKWIVEARKVISMWFDIPPFSFGMAIGDTAKLDAEVRELSVALNKATPT